MSSQKIAPRVEVVTTKYNGIARVYKVKMQIGSSIDKGKKIAVNAIWDTGCTNTTISKKIAEELNLTSFGVVASNTAGGTAYGNEHLVDLYLPNNVVITDFKIVAMPELGVECLIGTDILSLGDFAVSNHQGETVVNFRMPSCAGIDYVQWVNNMSRSKSAIKTGRNDSCPCGSTKKYKNCCGKSL